jgi:hypothetical protein
MTKKEEFLVYVFTGAVANDLLEDSTNAQLVARLAMDIPEQNLPDCPANAAKAFLAYCSGRTDRPFRWMIPPRQPAWDFSKAGRAANSSAAEPDSSSRTE